MTDPSQESHEDVRVMFYYISKFRAGIDSQPGVWIGYIKGGSHNGVFKSCKSVQGVW